MRALDVWSINVTEANRVKNIKVLTCNLIQSKSNIQHGLHPQRQGKFQRFQATSKFPSSHSPKIKAFLVEGDSWGRQQATAGLLLQENREGRRRMITGNYWQTCQPAGQESGRPQPSTTTSTAHLMPQPPPYILQLHKMNASFTFQTPKIILSDH